MGYGQSTNWFQENSVYFTDEALQAMPITGQWLDGKPMPSLDPQQPKKDQNNARFQINCCP
jgi:hypothetical protein